MSVHIPSTLKVTDLNVARSAKVGHLRFQDGEDESWLLYADSNSVKLLYNTTTSASFVLDEESDGALSLNVPGVVYGTGVQAELVTADQLVLNGPATIAGTLEADTLKANTLDVSNLDFSDTTLNVSSISVAGTAEINTLSAVQVSAEQGAIEQLTVADTLDANSAVLSELTVLQTLHAGTIKARKLAVDEELSANTITASFLNVDGWIDAKSLTVNGVPIMGGGSSGDDSGDDISTDLAVDSVTATKYVEVLGAVADKGIVLDAEDGLQLGTGASLTVRNLYDASVDPYVTIDIAGVKAATIHGNTVKGALIQGTTIQGQTVTGATINATNLTAESMASETLQAVTLTVDDTITSQELDTSILVADQLSANFLNIANSLQVQPSSDESPSFSITTDNANQAALSLTGSAVIDGSLSVTSLKVNGVDITDNGGEVELPPTIRVSKILSLSPHKAVLIPQIQGEQLTLRTFIGELSPSETPPLALHIFLRQESNNDDSFAHSEAISLRAESGFRAPVTFVSPVKETQVLPLDEARFTQRTIATACQDPANGIAMGDVTISSSYIYCNRAWFEVCPAGLNSINNEQSTVTLRADRALINDNGNTALDIVSGEITPSSDIYCLNSVAFTLTPETLTARATRQLPHSVNVGYYDKDTSNTPADSTLLAYTTDIKTEITPSCFKAEATATLAPYEKIKEGSLIDYLDNTKAEIQLDVSPAAYTSDLSYVPNAENMQSGIYVRPKHVIIQAPFDQNTDVSYDDPVDLYTMGVGLFGRKIDVRAKSIRLGAATSIIGTLHVKHVSVVGSLSAKSLYVNGRGITGAGGGIKLGASTSVIGTLHVSGLAKANTASVVGSLSAQSLYVNGVQITGNSSGEASGSGFSGQYTEGNVVLGYTENSDFIGFAQKDFVTALGYNVYNPSTTEIPSFYDTTANATGIRIDPSEIMVTNMDGRMILDAQTLQLYGRRDNLGVRVDTKNLQVMDIETGSPMVRLNASSTGATRLHIGEPDVPGGLRLHSLEIAAINTTILGAFNSKMFSLHSLEGGAAAINLNANYNSKLSLHPTKGFYVEAHGKNLISTNAGSTRVWELGNTQTYTKFFTNYGDVTDNLYPQDVLDNFAASSAIHACLPLSLMLELFQLKSGLSLPSQS